jgi:hypothetical protein
MRAHAMKLRPLRDPTEVELQPMQDNPRYAAKFAELQALEARLKQSEHRQRVGEALRRGQKATVSVAERAKELLAGGQVVATTAPAEIEAALEERSILQQAIFEKRGELQALAAELSFEACKQFAPLAEDGLRSVLAAIDQLYVALEVGRQIRGKLAGAGYTLNENVLPIYQFADAAVLGDSRLSGISGKEISPGVFTPGRDLSCTPAFRFRAWLRQRGIIDG